jgi:hypothetical protein
VGDDLTDAGLEHLHKVAGAHVGDDTVPGLLAWDSPDGTWSHPPALGESGAGLVSAADDLLAFARMLLSGGGRC